MLFNPEAKELLRVNFQAPLQTEHCLKVLADDRWVTKPEIGNGQSSIYKSSIDTSHSHQGDGDNGRGAHRLSVLTDYYIRKLVRRYTGRLKSVVAQGASLVADTQTKIDRVLESLYLEPEELEAQVKELEILIRYHQQLEQNHPKTTAQLKELEQKILWAIGFKVLETAVAAPKLKVISEPAGYATALAA